MRRRRRRSEMWADCWRSREKVDRRFL